MLILLDNTLLSNFALVERPDLIRLALGETAATTEEAFAEFRLGEQLGRLPHGDWSWLPVFQLNEAERAIYSQLREHLNAGEAACLAMASVRGYRVFTDDRDAREVAVQMQVPVSGTLGLLVRLIGQSHLTLVDANDLLHRMIVAGYRSPISDLGEIL
jgi:predicted nucleic acid-binding protein